MKQQLKKSQKKLEHIQQQVGQKVVIKNQTMVEVIQ
jgi:DNA-binding XRE family transcriptional regulator